MQFSWFGLHWQWIGLAMSLPLWVLLLTTNMFRSNPKISRWRDPVGLAWLAPAGYMIHQAEEYGIDLLGRLFVLIPLSLRVACAMAGNSSVRKSGVGVLLLVGVMLNELLVVSLVALSHSLISGNAFVGIQIVNPFWYVLLPWLKERYDMRRGLVRA